MLKNVLMPTLGLDMEKATIQTWLKQEGEQVTKDEPLLVVETDKASIEINASETGILRQILHSVGTSVPVTRPIAVIETSASAEATDVASPPAAAPSLAPEASSSATSSGAASASPNAESQGIRASPAARRVGRELGVDLSWVRGSGPAGRIQGEDVLRFAEVRGSTAPESIVATPPAPAGSGMELPGHLVPWGRKRRLTAQRMALSARTVARITLNVEADATETIRLRTNLLPIIEAKHGVRVSYNDILVKVVATSLTEYPHMNARWTENGIYLVEPINVGIAVATDDGLVVPVIRNADRKKLTEISIELSRMTDKARESQLHLEEITGGTFTITNLGLLGVDSFIPLVNPPETGILGVGCIAGRPVGRDGQVVLRPTMTLSLSVDHRIVDGAPAARFLQRIRQLLESPSFLVSEDV